jgi:hypothetical protein
MFPIASLKFLSHSVLAMLQLWGGEAKGSMTKHAFSLGREALFRLLLINLEIFILTNGLFLKIQIVSFTKK